jgi:hypothetical protein
MTFASLRDEIINTVIAKVSVTITFEGQRILRWVTRVMALLLFR